MRRLSSYENYTLDNARAEVWETTRCMALLRKGIKAEKAFEVAPRKWELHWQQSCLTPRWKHIVSRGGAYGKLASKFSIVQAVRCRKCEGCLESKARYWAALACTEFRYNHRTLMVTFTSTPEQDALWDIEVARKNDISKLSSEELFVARASVFYDELQLYLKRVRAAALYRSGMKNALRYLIVAERHGSTEKTAVEKRGRPHFHGLIYETKPGALVLGDPTIALSTMAESGEYVGKYYKDSKGVWKKGVFLTDESLLRQQWKLGWNKFQVAFDELSAFYVLKYIAKDGIYRVFNSERFGDEEFLASQTKTGDENNHRALADPVDLDRNSQNTEITEYGRLLRQLSCTDGSSE